MLKKFQDDDAEIAKNASYFFLEFLFLDANELRNRINKLVPYLKPLLFACLNNL